MFEEKAKKLNLCELEYGQIVWSEYFKCYVVYAGKDFDEDFCFKFFHKDGYCIIYSSGIYDAPSLLKELV
jgi:hypothetical protein